MAELRSGHDHCTQPGAPTEHGIGKNENVREEENDKENAR